MHESELNWLFHWEKGAILKISCLYLFCRDVQIIRESDQSRLSDLNHKNWVELNFFPFIFEFLKKKKKLKIWVDLELDIFWLGQLDGS